MNLLFQNNYSDRQQVLALMLKKQSQHNQEKISFIKCLLPQKKPEKQNIGYAY